MKNQKSNIVAIDINAVKSRILEVRPRETEAGILRTYTHGRSSCP